jgi:hypothetical protein
MFSGYPAWYSNPCTASYLRHISRRYTSVISSVDHPHLFFPSSYISATPPYFPGVIHTMLTSSLGLLALSFIIPLNHLHVNAQSMTATPMVYTFAPEPPLMAQRPIQRISTRQIL